MHIHGRKVEVSPVTWMLVGVLAASVAVPSWTIMYLLYHYSPSFEHGQRKTFERPKDRNWQIVHQLGPKAWHDLDPQTFADLNAGDWRELCVNGGHTDPVATFEGRFGKGRMPKALRRLFDRPLPVGDYDLVVSYAGHDGKVDALYFVDGGSMQSLQLAWCTQR